MKDFEIIDNTDSTNEYIKSLYSEKIPEEGAAVATFNQTNGRGQVGNKWLSNPGDNICYSIIFRPDNIPAMNQFIISQAIALSVKSFLDRYIQNVFIKWPNDIFWKTRKIAGILIENQLRGSSISYSIAGIGININQNQFSEEIPNAVSLKQITGLNYDLINLTEELHNLIFMTINNLSLDKNEEIQRYYLNNMFRRDGFHNFTDKNGNFKAKIRGVSAQGNLIIELEDKNIRTYGFKDVQFNLE
jgi:BirA family transcriptional regulator, biotin operon repressor / biotin---[acetyl-CoA-carboxylase] ligase